MKLPYLIFGALLAAAPAAQAVHVCTDAQGKRSYQDQPCALKAANPALAPLAAAQLTPALAMGTVQRFRQAVEQRDPMAASRLLAEDFKAEVHKATSRRSYNRAVYVQAMDMVLSAASGISSQPRCVPAAGEGGLFVVTCEVTDRMDILSRSVTTKSTDTYRVKVEGGEAKLAGVLTVVHSSDRVDRASAQPAPQRAAADAQQPGSR